MTIESTTISLPKSAAEVFNFLREVKNFESLMPEHINKFEILEEDTFIFALSGMPEIVLKKTQENPNTTIVLGAAGGKLDFSLKANIKEISTDNSEVQLEFSGDFNPMMSMMIKGPITKFIDTLATNIPKAV